MSRPAPRRSRRMFAGIALLVTAITTVATATFDSSPARAAVTCGSETLIGSGSAADPYRVTTSAQLAVIGTGSCTLSSAYRQEADLALTGAWTPIGSDATPFTGTYDGANHSISGMAITGVGFLGMFAAANGATIRDLNLSGTVSATAVSSQYVGMLAGAATTSVLTGISVTATVSASLASGNSLVGGVVGNAFDVTISAVTMNGVVDAPSGKEIGGIVGKAAGLISVNGSHNRATVSGDDYVGGLIGQAYLDTTIASSTSTGTITGADDYVGGVIGRTRQMVTISDLTVTGAISGESETAGLIGQSDDSVTITGTTASGTVSGRGDYVGGLIGEAMRNVTITDSRSDGVTTGVGSDSDYIGGLIGQSDDSVTITGTTATGAVNGDDEIGGLIGDANGDVTITETAVSGTINGDDDIGGLIGDANGNVTITDVTSTATVTGTGDVIGGSIGYSGSSRVTIANSLRNGTTRGVGGDSDEVGGLIGEGDYVTVSATAVIGEVSGTGSNIGGLIGLVHVGVNSGQILIERVTRSGATEGDYDVGGLIGEADGDVLIENSTVTGSVIARNRTVGGIIGYVDNVATSNIAIVDSSSSADVEAQTGGIAGGLIGDVDNDGALAGAAVIRRSSARGDVLAVGTEVGGLIGRVLSPATATVEYSFSTGSVTGSDLVGGLVGHATSNQFSLSDSYALGDVTATAGIAGGAIGSVTDGALTRVYTRGRVQGTVVSGALVGALASSTITSAFFNSAGAGTATSAAGVDADLTDIATFSSAGWAIVAGWGYFSAPGQVWGVCDDVNGATPYLLWEYRYDACTTPPPPPSATGMAPAPEIVAGDEPDDEASGAVAVSRLVDYAAVVFLVARDAPADALVAAAAGARAGGPVLVTDRGTVPQATLSEIERLGVVRIVLVGGIQRISSAIEDLLRNRYPDIAVERLAGDDRTTTAADVTTRQFVNGSPLVYLAAADAPADAVIAAAQGAPVLYTQRDEVPATTVSELRRLAPERIVLVGGPVRIAESVAVYLRDTFEDTEVSRLGGADRYETAALLADTTRSRVMLVDGRLDRIDSITAAATARLTDTTLLLSGRTCAPASTLRLLEGRSVLTVGIVGTQSCS